MHATNNGTAKSVSTQAFNERVKRLLATKPDDAPPEKPQRAAKRFVRNGNKT